MDCHVAALLAVTRKEADVRGLPSPYEWPRPPSLALRAIHLEGKVPTKWADEVRHIAAKTAMAKHRA